MLDRSMVGTRIRQRRVMTGLKQAELAERAGISASYLNLIEHNRRRIGGRTLLQIAQVLEVEPSLLSEGAGAQLLATLKEAAAGRSDAALDARAEANPELDRIEEFAGRFPGWAALLASLTQRCEDMEQTITVLTERLAHDPQLAEALHEVISTATSIRATAAILAETRELEPEWQMRFHRNINEDGSRLAEGAEALMHYLEAAPDTSADIRSPQDELHAFLESHGFHFSQLEGWGAAPRVDAIVENSAELRTGPAQELARAVLRQYVEDARALPLDDMRRYLDRNAPKPDVIAAQSQQPLGRVFRRLANLPEDMVDPVGLITIDGAGAILLRKPVLGFSVPRNGAACTLWPIYDCLAQPGRPQRQILRQGDVRLEALAVAEEFVPARFDRGPLIRAHMLLVPVEPGHATAAARDVGVTCQICSMGECQARREPSILSSGL
ncbi:helix-turn-helix domain-containing protein [Roseovarius phycicola]|uniref:Helix-turn-helix domain-containing protein n=1 Tax=Roseovarius phycicola TaxID=3080976 RepID=A0ABZ2HML7_9RHOB